MSLDNTLGPVHTVLCISCDYKVSANRTYTKPPVIHSDRTCTNCKCQYPLNYVTDCSNLMIAWGPIICNRILILIQTNWWLFRNVSVQSSEQNTTLEDFSPACVDGRIIITVWSSISVYFLIRSTQRAQ